MTHDWKTWEVGMKLYVPYKKEISSAKGIECPICKGQGELTDPFTNEIYSCPGVIVREQRRYTCVKGKIFPCIIFYKFKEYELDSFSVKYPQEILSSITLLKRDYINWLEVETSKVYLSKNLEEKHFFKTEKEAQEYCDKMNQEMESKNDR